MVKYLWQIGLVLVLGGTAQAQGLAPDPIDAALSPAIRHPLEPQPLSVRTYAESYTFIADAQGTYVQIQLAISNLGDKPGKGGCRLLVVGEGEPWEDRRQVYRENWGFESAPHPTLRVGTCSVEALPGATKVVIPQDSGTLTIVYAASLTAIHPPFARIEVESTFLENEVLLPWSAVEVKLERHGFPPRVLKGQGFSDHARSTSLPTMIAEGWVRFRGLAPTGSVLIQGRLLPDEGGVEGWVWHQGGEPQQLTRLLDYESKPGEVIRMQASKDVYKIHVGPQLFRNAPVERIGVMGHLVALIVGNPVTRTFRAKLNGPHGTLSGILELNWADEADE